MRLPLLFSASMAVWLGICAKAGFGQTDAIHGKDGIIVPAPPAVQKSPVVDEYRSKGSDKPVQVTDDYRWLEEAKSKQTRA